jgi:hypothetical protein
MCDQFDYDNNDYLNNKSVGMSKKKGRKYKIIRCKLSSCVTIKHLPKVHCCLKCHKLKEIEKLIIRRKIKIVKKNQQKRKLYSKCILKVNYLIN